jgi:hypothetical protein
LKLAGVQVTHVAGRLSQRLLLNVLYDAVSFWAQLGPAVFASGYTPQTMGGYFFIHLFIHQLIYYSLSLFIFISFYILLFFLVQLGYLDVTIEEKLRSGWPGPFVKVVISHSFAFSASRRLNSSDKSILPCAARVFRRDSPGKGAQWLARSIRESQGAL